MTDPKTDAIIQVKDLNKWYGDFHVLKNINLEVKRQEKIVICGPSGSGKSTLIRCINRLEEHQKGKIIVDGIETDQQPEKHRNHPNRGRYGVQHFNLFPHLTILDNLTLGPIWVRKVPKRSGRNRYVLPGKSQDRGTGQ